MCGFEFREAELGESSAWWHIAGFTSVQETYREKSGESFASGHTDSGVKLHKVWRTERRGSEANPVRAGGVWSF